MTSGEVLLLKKLIVVKNCSYVWCGVLVSQGINEEMILQWENMFLQMSFLKNSFLLSCERCTDYYKFGEDNVNI